MQSTFRLAISRNVIARAAKYALVVGFVLIAINHGDALLRGEIDWNRAIKMVLTVCVPYLVSTFSSVGAMRELLGPVSAEREADV